MYYCNVSTCPDNEQTLFCAHCYDDKHPDHKSLMIAMVLKKETEKWQTFRKELNDITTQISDEGSLGKRINIIKYLEGLILKSEL